MENEMIKDLAGATSEQIAREAVKVLLEKKAKNVKLFFVKDYTSVTDYYVNATGRSSLNVTALADDVDRLLGERGCKPLRMEGKSGKAWILADYGDVIVNVFDKESREFYNLDRHLPEGTEVDISDLVAEVDLKFGDKN